MRRLSTERFLRTLHGCSLQTVVVFMLSGRESSSAFRADRCDSHFTSGQELDAALPTVSIFDFGPRWMFRKVTDCENGQVSEAVVSWRLLVNFIGSRQTWRI